MTSRSRQNTSAPELVVSITVLAILMSFVQLRKSTTILAQHQIEDAMRMPLPDVRASSKRQRPPIKIPIVMEGTGELGNHLYKIVYGKAVQFVARDEFNIDTKLIMRDHRFHKKPHKSITFTTSRDVLMGCFPNVSSQVDYDFLSHAQSRRELISRIASQTEWLGKALAGKLFMSGGTGFNTIQEGLTHLRKIMDDMNSSEGDSNKMCEQMVRLKDGTRGVSSYKCLPPITLDDDATFGVPFILLTEIGTSVHLDRYYEEMRNFLFYNESGVVGSEKEACCNQSPGPEEAVLHFRNFRHEVTPAFMKKVTGFIELGAQKTAAELFKDLQPGDGVAIATRFDVEKSPETKKYVDALTQRGLKVRVISGQKPYQDFCFMKRSRKLLVGSAFSTFSTFAGFLSNDRSLVVSRYLINTPKWAKEENISWTNPELKGRMRFGLYNQ